MLRNSLVLKAIFILGLASTMTGCAGAETKVVADGAHYPISLSRGVRDSDGSLVTSDRREVVGQVEIHNRVWGLLYSGIDLNPETDISSEIDREVAEKGGDAVVNLAIVNQHCALDYFHPLTILPFWPGCANVTVRGDIIRVKRVPAPVASKESR